FFFQAEDGIRAPLVTGVQTCALPISGWHRASAARTPRRIRERRRTANAAGARSRAGHPQPPHFCVPKPALKLNETAFPVCDYDQIGRASCRERVEIEEDAS